MNQTQCQGSNAKGRNLNPCRNLGYEIILSIVFNLEL
jgi:hypothetical protein